MDASPYRQEFRWRRYEVRGRRGEAALAGAVPPLQKLDKEDGDGEQRLNTVEALAHRQRQRPLQQAEHIGARVPCRDPGVALGQRLRDRALGDDALVNIGSARYSEGSAPGA